MQTIKPEETKKILVRVPNWIGDAVLAIPALTVIRSYYKNSEITFLGLDPIQQLLKENQIADHFIFIQKNHTGVFGKWRLIQELKEKRFNLAILLQNAFEAALITSLSSIPNRFGYRKDGRGFLLTHPIFPPRSEKVHQMEYYLRLIGFMTGTKPYWKAPSLVVTEEEKGSARRVLEGHGIARNDLIIGINAGAAYGSAKRWIPERFAQLGERLIKEKNAKLIFFGSSGEDSLIENMINSMSVKPVNMAGKTKIRELAALISQCSLFITNDSGPMHIASALKVPLISLFGPTDSITTSPVGFQNTMIKNETECSPCLLRECPIDHRCMTSISVEEVMEVIHHKLACLESPSVPAVFLDRDGTLNEDTNYVSSEEKFHLFAETPEAIALLNQIKMPAFIITNQSGVARGFFTEAFLQNLHLKLERKLTHFKARIDGVYYCPHHPDAGCNCRKPKTGLIEQILQKKRIDLQNSYVIGDQLSDLELADRIGAKGVLVLTGKGKETLEKLKDSSGQITSNYVAENILDAARWIKEDLRNTHLDKNAPENFPSLDGRGRRGG